MCGQCIRSNRVCGGYQKNRVFVLVQPAAKKKHIFLRPPISESEPNSAFTPNAVDYSRETTTLYEQSASTIIQVNDMTHSMPDISPANAMMQKRNDCHNLVQTFLADCFPSQRSSPSPRSWITLLVTLPTEVKALQLSSAAVAASAIGRKFHNTALVRNSHNLYIQGLRHLQHALQDRALVRNDGTLAACMALRLYEAMECPSGGSGAYFSHCEGIMALVQARGVEAHSSGAGHQLFLGIRIPAVSSRSTRSSLIIVSFEWVLTTS
jgi:hypothetical protein